MRKRDILYLGIGGVAGFYTADTIAKLALGLPINGSPGLVNIPYEIIQKYIPAELDSAAIFEVLGMLVGAGGGYKLLNKIESGLYNVENKIKNAFNRSKAPSIKTSLE